MPFKKRWADRFIRLSENTTLEIEQLLEDFKQQLQEGSGRAAFITENAYRLCNKLVAESVSHGAFLGHLMATLNLCNFWALVRGHRIRIKHNSSDVCGKASGLLLRYLVDQLIIETDKFFTMAPVNKIILPQKLAISVYKLLKTARARAVGYNKVMGIKRVQIMKTGSEVILKGLQMDTDNKISAKVKAYCLWVFARANVDELFKPMTSSKHGVLTEKIEELPFLQGKLPRTIFRSHASAKSPLSKTLPVCLLEDSNNNSDSEDDDIFMDSKPSRKTRPILKLVKGPTKLPHVSKKGHESPSTSKTASPSKPMKGDRRQQADMKKESLSSSATVSRPKRQQSDDESDTDTAESDFADSVISDAASFKGLSDNSSSDNSDTESSNSDEDSTTSEEDPPQVDGEKAKSSATVQEQPSQRISQSQDSPSSSKRKGQGISEKTLAALSSHLIKRQKPSPGSVTSVTSAPSGQSTCEKPAPRPQSSKKPQTTTPATGCRVAPKPTKSKVCATQQRRGSNSPKQIGPGVKEPEKSVSGIFVPRSNQEPKKARPIHPPGTQWTQFAAPVNTSTAGDIAPASCLDDIEEAIKKITQDLQSATSEQSQDVNIEVHTNQPTESTYSLEDALKYLESDGYTDPGDITASTTFSFLDEIEKMLIE